MPRSMSTRELAWCWERGQEGRMSTCILSVCEHKTGVKSAACLMLDETDWPQLKACPAPNGPEPSPAPLSWREIA